MPEKRPVRKPERKKQAAMIWRGKTNSSALQARIAAANLGKAIKAAEPLLSAVPAKAGLASLRQAEADAKDFIGKRAGLIKVHRRQVEASVAAGIVPLKPYDYKLHENYVKATQLIKQIGRYRQKLLAGQ